MTAIKKKWKQYVSNLATAQILLATRSAGSLLNWVKNSIKQTSLTQIINASISGQLIMISSWQHKQTMHIIRSHQILIADVSIFWHRLVNQLIDLTTKEIQTSGGRFSIVPSVSSSMGSNSPSKGSILCVKFWIVFSTWNQICKCPIWSLQVVISPPPNKVFQPRSAILHQKPRMLQCQSPPSREKKNPICKNRHILWYCAMLFNWIIYKLIYL